MRPPRRKLAEYPPTRRYALQTAPLSPPQPIPLLPLPKDKVLQISKTPRNQSNRNKMKRAQLREPRRDRPAREAKRDAATNARRHAVSGRAIVAQASRLGPSPRGERTI